MEQESEIRLSQEEPDELVGSFRRFGPHGPAYVILNAPDACTVTIRVLETGETLPYPLRHVLADPQA
jgi:hypothetical protein